MTDRWPNLMKPSTARAFLDMGAEKFRHQVAPFLTRRLVGGRFYYRKSDLERFCLGPLDGAAAAGDRRSPQEWLKAVADDLAASPRRSSRRE
jgi:hypothetical protein